MRCPHVCLTMHPVLIKLVMYKLSMPDCCIRKCRFPQYALIIVQPALACSAALRKGGRLEIAGL